MLTTQSCFRKLEVSFQSLDSIIRRLHSGNSSKYGNWNSPHSKIYFKKNKAPTLKHLKCSFETWSPLCWLHGHVHPHKVVHEVIKLPEPIRILKLQHLPSKKVNEYQRSSQRSEVRGPHSPKKVWVNNGCVGPLIFTCCLLVSLFVKTVFCKAEELIFSLLSVNYIMFSYAI